MKKTKPNIYQLLACKCKMTKKRRIDRAVTVAIVLLFALAIAAGVIGFFSQKALADIPQTTITVPEKKPEQPSLKLYTKDEAIKQIKQIAEARNFKWSDYLIRLVDCESKFNQFAINKQSTATGWYQIIDAHKLTRGERFDLDFSTNWAMNMIEAGHQTAWACDPLIKIVKK